MKSSLVLFCSCLCVASLHAADVYRWVDDTGRTQYSDVVPQKYRNSARRIDTQPPLTDEQRAQAEARANRDLKEADEIGRTAGLPPSGAAGSGTGAPADFTPPANADCATQHRLYRESQECFAPFRMATGAVKPEAFNICGAPVFDPSPQCGPPPAY